jgi:hypothetical protein
MFRVPTKARESQSSRGLHNSPYELFDTSQNHDELLLEQDAFFLTGLRAPAHTHQVTLMLIHLHQVKRVALALPPSFCAMDVPRSQYSLFRLWN